MRAARRLALEVQLAGAEDPVAVRGSGCPALVELASATARAGMDLWVVPGSRGAAAGRRRWTDQTVGAGALVASVRDRMIGVVASPAEGRHPAVLAREVTTLDVLSGGRAALLLHGEPSAGVEAVPPAALAEAATICHELFTEEQVTVPGATYRVEGAVNRPRPVRPGGPVLALQLPREVADVAGYADVTPVDALVVTGDEEVVRARRRALDGLGGRAEPGVPPALLWRGPLPRAAVKASGVLRELLAAGADGFIVQVGPDQPVSAEWLAAVRQAARPAP